MGFLTGECRVLFHSIDNDLCSSGKLQFSEVLSVNCNVQISVQTTEQLFSLEIDLSENKANLYTVMCWVYP